MRKLTEEEKTNFNKCALKEFPETKYCEQAGWIKPDGKMLDLSGDGGMVRYRDHREIQFCLPDDIKRSEVIPTGLEELGMIRVHTTIPRKKEDHSSININLTTKNEPTWKQWNTIKKCVKILDKYPNSGFWTIYEIDDIKDIKERDLPEIDETNIPISQIETLKSIYEGILAKMIK